MKTVMNTKYWKVNKATNTYLRNSKTKGKIKRKFIMEIAVFHL